MKPTHMQSTQTALIFRIFITIVMLGSLLQAAIPAQASTAIVDGTLDAAYGAPIAIDQAGDGNGNANMDLLELYATEDADFFYFAFTANADLVAANWGKYVIYIDTDGVADSGATSDAWGRNVVAANPHKPEYAIYTWIDAVTYDPSSTQVVHWTGSGWDWGTVAALDEVALGAGNTSMIEWKIAKAKLGNPTSMWLEVWSTGGDGSNAQDTLNFPAEDWNATDWSTTAVLAVSAPYFVMDGAREAAWGEPVSVDPLSDMDEPNLDLHGLYLAEDASSYYIGLDAYASTWGMTYGIYLDTDQIEYSGAHYDPWGRSVSAYFAHMPEHTVYVRHDGGDWLYEPQFNTWDGGSWDYPSLVSVGGAYGYNGANDWLEYRIPKAELGYPTHLALEAFTTGGSGHAQDTVPSDPNVAYTTPDWGIDFTALSNFYVYPPIVEPPGASHDDNIWWNELGHDSRSTTYRTPGGAVPTGTPVLLRLRAASGDLTAAQVRLYNDRTNAQSFLDMARVADDGTYEWWQASVPASADPTVYWYRFIAIDGTDTDYYEDDNLRTGGWGMVYDESADVSYQLTVYDPAFQTPDWVKNAIVYQVFPDRFRDGDSTNNTPAGTFFYNETGGTVYRSLDPEGDWNTVVCDPRDTTTTCAGTYSKNFYGGDLQGLTEKLDYLQGLGINTIYLNPIFESPSNHKYDTTDYMAVDDAFGGNEAYAALVTELSARGMYLILDGVFNHTSSDSIFFDRYHRYDSIGACEDPASPYRDWYYFYAPPSGTPGVCAGDDGAPNALLYESWFGFDSLPKLRANDQDVRDYIWALGDASVAPYWIIQGAEGWRLDVGGDVDPGTLNDPANDYWEGFRDALHAASPDPQPYIVGEEWGNATSWTIGGEWDATMNYQYSSAMLGLWVDRAFFDNDHNYGSSAGVIEPLMPSQLDERLHNWQERYAPEAFYAMMNLLGSHDTNRALFMLDKNTYLNDETIYENPDYDWSDAITRLKGVVILQMTLPGAPTIYYGDEIGLVGPPAYANDKWEDDPYNRQPYPWLDETGTPFYTRLNDPADTKALYDYYALLTGARNAHPALRTGSFDTLLIDDPNLAYAYGRKLAEASDAAIVIVNRHDTAYNAVLDLNGYLPYGTSLLNVLDNQAYTVGGDGSLSISIPPMTGAVLVTQAAFAPAPTAVTDLAVSFEGDQTLTLTWTPAAGATGYEIYRSLLDGGGYSWVGTTSDSTYTDTGLVNGGTYYYVVVALNSTTGLVSGYSNQAQGIPHPTIGWANLQWPETINHTIGILPTPDIYGRVWIDGYTSLPGATPGLLAQVGFGAADSAPATWTTWVEAAFNVDVDNNDEFMGQLLPETLGVFDYVYRYSTSGGRDWVYADLSGPIADPTQAAPDPGILTVDSSGDTTPLDAPLNLRVTSQSATEVALAWDAVPDSDVYAYDLYRSEDSASLGVKVARLLSPIITYVDTDVVSGATYYYVVRALDTSFNVSADSNQVSATPAPRLVDVTLVVEVPPYTPDGADLYFSRYVNPDGTIGGWDPAATKIEMWNGDYVDTLTILEGTLVEFKFTRGSWDTVEKDAFFEEIANRQLLVEYGFSGISTVYLKVDNWRDPLVAATSPVDEAVDVPLNATVITIWSRKMAETTTFEVKLGDQPVDGTFSFDEYFQTLTFTPTELLELSSTYTVNVAGQVADSGDWQQVPLSWSFTTLGVPPSVSFSASEFLAFEDAGYALVTIELSEPATRDQKVFFSAYPGTASDSDFEPTYVDVSFVAGEQSKQVQVPIINDTSSERIETILLKLSLPSYATLSEPFEAVLYLFDDENSSYCSFYPGFCSKK